MRFIGNALVVLKGRREVLDSAPHIIYHNLQEGWGDDDYCFGWTDEDYSHPCNCYNHPHDSCERIQWEINGFHGKEPNSCTCLPCGDYHMAPLYCGETYTHECHFCEVAFNEADSDGWEERVLGEAIDSFWGSLPLRSINLIRGIRLNDGVQFKESAHVWLCDGCTHELDNQLQAGVTDPYALEAALVR